MSLAMESLGLASTADNLAERNSYHHHRGQGSRRQCRSRDGDQDRQQDQQGTPGRQAVGHQDSPSSQGLEIYTKKLDRQRQPQKIFLGWRRGNKHARRRIYHAAQGCRTPRNPRTESSRVTGAEPPTPPTVVTDFIYTEFNDADVTEFSTSPIFADLN